MADFHLNLTDGPTLRDEVTRLSDKDQLLIFARRWLYNHKLLIEHDRALRSQIVAALDLLESVLYSAIEHLIPIALNFWIAWSYLLWCAVQRDGWYKVFQCRRVFEKNVTGEPNRQSLKPRSVLYLRRS